MAIKAFLKKRISAFKHAFSGVFYLVSKESHFKLHLLGLITIILAGFYFSISPMEWLAQLLAAALVLSLETVNTAIEKTLDFLHPDNSSNVKLIKDLAAAAVLICAIFAIIVAGIIYLPKIL